MGEEQHVERIDESMPDEKLTWEKPALKVYPIDNTTSEAGTGADGQDESGMTVVLPPSLGG